MAVDFLLRKIIGSQQLSACDPFILADHVGPIRYGAGEALGVPDHPHRGLVVVTYVVEGGMRHQDSLGHNGTSFPPTVSCILDTSLSYGRFI